MATLKDNLEQLRDNIERIYLLFPCDGDLPIDIYDETINLYEQIIDQLQTLEKLNVGLKFS